MKRIILLFSFLLLSSAVKVSDLTDHDQKVDDEIMNDMLNQGTPDRTEGDKKVTDDQNDYKSLVNGQMLNPEEIDFVEDPTVTIDGVPQGDEMNQPAEDPAPYGWKYFNYTWCTTEGRSLIYSSTEDPIDHLECQMLCINMSGCKAIEHWGNYNNACFVCVNQTLMEPYTNENDLAYPAHVWVQSRYRCYVCPSITLNPSFAAEVAYITAIVLCISAIFFK